MTSFAGIWLAWLVGEDPHPAATPSPMVAVAT
jgi:hypothetical protein